MSISSKTPGRDSNAIANVPYYSERGITNRAVGSGRGKIFFEGKGGQGTEDRGWRFED